MDDILIECIECEYDFLFTVKDQAFYKQQSFEDPKRCKDCRDARKNRPQKPQNRGNVRDDVYNQSRGHHNGGQTRNQDSRPHWPIVCINCNEHAMVPFEPRGPARCKRCHWDFKNRGRQNFSHANH